MAVSRFNEAVTRRLLDGARATLAERDVGEDLVDVVWVPGAFELPVAVARGLDTGRYRCAVALGAVVRGETPHFDVIVAEATRGIGDVALQTRVPIGFGLITAETMEQAMARAGGDAGNKGSEAAAAALETVDALERLSGDAAS